jgi:hypothetical protein
MSHVHVPRSPFSVNTAVKAQRAARASYGASCPNARSAAMSCPNARSAAMSAWSPSRAAPACLVAAFAPGRGAPRGARTCRGSSQGHAGAPAAVATPAVLNPVNPSSVCVVIRGKFLVGTLLPIALFCLSFQLYTIVLTHLLIVTVHQHALISFALKVETEKANTSMYFSCRYMENTIKVSRPPSPCMILCMIWQDH